MSRNQKPEWMQTFEEMSAEQFRCMTKKQVGAPATINKKGNEDK